MYVMAERTLTGFPLKWDIYEAEYMVAWRKIWGGGGDYNTGEVVLGCERTGGEWVREECHQFVAAMCVNLGELEKM